MPQVINTNMMSLNSQRSLNRTQLSMQTSVERLSSGLRVNRARDDAAGMAIIERISSQIRGLDQSIRNANDGISLMQTAEGAMAELTNNLQRMRELAVQAANGTYNDTDRLSLHNEYAALQQEMTRTINSTEFNEVVLLGSTTTLTMQVGWKDGADNQVDISTTNLTRSTGSGGISYVLGSAGATGGVGVSTVTDALSAMARIENAINRITEIRAKFGAAQNRLESAIRNMENVIENQSAARSRIQDADFAKETANLTRTQILQQAGTAMLAQANQLPQSVLQLLQ